MLRPVTGAVAALLALVAANSSVEAQQAGVTFDGAALIMKRQESSVPIVSTTADPAGGGIFKSNDFNEGWSTGLEAGVHLRYGAFGLMIRGIKLSDDASQSATFAPGLPALKVNTNPLTNYAVPGGAILRGDYKSDTGSLEIDVSYRALPGLTVFAGPRWFHIDDSFALTGASLAGAAFERDSWRVSNRLLGGQIGAQMALMRLLSPGYAGPFDVTAKVAGGWAHNSIDTGFVVGTPNDIFRQASATGGTSSKFVEAGAELSYAILPSVSLSAGYKMLWIGDVATALHQVGATGNYGGANNPPYNITTTDVLYHGFTGRVTLQLN